MHVLGCIFLTPSNPNWRNYLFTCPLCVKRCSQLPIDIRRALCTFWFARGNSFSSWNLYLWHTYKLDWADIMLKFTEFRAISIGTDQFKQYILAFIKLSVLLILKFLLCWIQKLYCTFFQSGSSLPVAFPDLASPKSICM